MMSLRTGDGRARRRQRGSLLLALLAALCATAASAQTPHAARIVDCRGPFARDSSHARLVTTFGRRNVRYQKVHGAEGEKLWASVLHPADAKARLEFIWNDEKRRRLPWMRIENASQSQNGIRVGMPLAEVERINGGRFSLSGFEWDYGGRVTDWRGGTLSRPLPGGCQIGIDFYPAENAPAAALDNVSGDQDFASDNADMRATRPTVGVLVIYYPKQ